MKLTKKIATGLVSASMLFNMAGPVLAQGSTTIELNGNGAGAQTDANVSVVQNTVVSQTNSLDVDNNISANSNTGDNNANRNTGGDVSVDTGDSKTLVGVSTTANSNVADVENCACDTDAEVLISGNGADSKNNAVLGLVNSTVVAQTNNADIDNDVTADSNTGDNRANRNTGGDVEVNTGNAFTHVELLNEANSNWARVGGGSGGSDVSLRILSNGADSENDIALGLAHSVVLQQYNDAEIDNDVDADATTGGNRADRNTGGSVGIDTGNAHTGVVVDNAANFNFADVDCDCLTDVLAKIAGNGAESDNNIAASLSDSLNVYQDNACGESDWIFELGWGWPWHEDEGCITNDLTADADTGYNKAKNNTGNPGTDPSVTTGNAETLVGVDNTGNANVFGDAPEAESPLGDFSGVNLNISFDLHDLLSALGLI